MKYQNGYTTLKNLPDPIGEGSRVEGEWLAQKYADEDQWNPKADPRSRHEILRAAYLAGWNAALSAKEK